MAVLENNRPLNRRTDRPRSTTQDLSRQPGEEPIATASRDDRDGGEGWSFRSPPTEAAGKRGEACEKMMAAKARFRLVPTTGA
jgi:hypothetical protein